MNTLSAIRRAGDLSISLGALSALQQINVLLPYR